MAAGVVLEVWCRARVHGPDARTDGCVCPEQWGVPYRPSRRSPVYRRTHAGRLHRTTAPDPDWAAIDRAVAGDLRVRLTTAELDAAIDRLDARGRSARETGRVLGVSARTVQRRRMARRTAGGA